MAINLFLVVFLLVSFYTDLRYRKIYNGIVFPTIVSGVFLNYLYYGYSGIGGSLLGLASGVLFLFIIYFLGGVGAGDVKFMAAVGSLKGTGFVLMGGLYGAVFSGFVAVIVLAFRGELVSKLKEIGGSLLCLTATKNVGALRYDTKNAVQLPYAALLAVGMFIGLVISFLR